MVRTYASAGALVVTGHPGIPRLLLLDQVRTTGERQTVAPKGRLKPGEAPFDAALREVTEESGVTALTYAAYLGQQKYTFTDNDDTAAAKTVDWFLLTTDDTTTAPAADEGFVGGRWVDPATARQVASHAKFLDVVDRAFALLDWRTTVGPFSTDVDALVRHVAADAATALTAHPGAGLGLCGSAARGDYVSGWSDLDIIGWGLPGDSDAAAHLHELVATLAHKYALHASLHFADAAGRDAGRAGPLYDMKLSAVLARVGVDVPVIAGRPPATAPDVVLPPADSLNLLLEFATTRLATRDTTDERRTDTARRVLSVGCSAGRATVQATAPEASLRLPDVVHALEARWPTAPIVALLRDYDTARRTASVTLATAEPLAARVPAAIADLRNRLTTPAP